MTMKMFQKLNILQLTGIEMIDYKKCKTVKRLCCLSICFHIWLIVAFIANMTAINLQRDNSDFAMALSYAISNSLCLTMFITLWIKRHQILKLKKTIEQLSINSASKAFTFLKISQILNLFLFVSYPTVFSFLLIKNIHPNSLLLAHMFAFIFHTITLPLSVTILFASCCCWCSTFLKVIASQMKSNSVVLNEKRIIGILRYYQFILHIAMSIERAFSAVAFFLLLSYLFIIFTYMGNLIRGYHSKNSIVRFQMSFNLTLKIYGMTVLIAFASEIPKVIESIKLKLCIMKEKMSLSDSNVASDVAKSLIDTFLKRDIFVISACNMIHFKRSMIITSFGTIISYGLLLLQFQ